MADDRSGFAGPCRPTRAAFKSAGIQEAQLGEMIRQRVVGGAGGGTNPEQLFAAGYAASFHGMLSLLAPRGQGRLCRCYRRRHGGLRARSTRPRLRTGGRPARAPVRRGACRGRGTGARCRTSVPENERNNPQCGARYHQPWQRRYMRRGFKRPAAFFFLFSLALLAGADGRPQ